MNDARTSMKARSGSALGRGARTFARASLFVALGLASAPIAAAAEAGDVRISAAADADDDDDLAVVGLMVDAGVPDGIGASLVIRPWSWLRLNGGVTHNLVSQGVRGGVSLIPLDLWILKISLNAEAGVFFPGDANKAVQMFSKDAEDITILSRVGYQYANGHVGLELGGDTFCLYLHAGWTYLHASFADGSQGTDAGWVVFKGEPTVTAFVPSAKAGLMLFLF